MFGITTRVRSCMKTSTRVLVRYLPNVPVIERGASVGGDESTRMKLCLKYARMAELLRSAEVLVSSVVEQAAFV